MYRIEWIWPVFAFGVLTLPMVPVFGAMLGLVMVVIVAAAILAAVVGAIVAPPFLLARAVHRHLRRRSGRALPAPTAQPSVSRASVLTAARQAAAPQARGALAR
jgi:hypothetical protein